jgi:hypothetical protein
MSGGKEQERKDEEEGDAQYKFHDRGPQISCGMSLVSVHELADWSDQ